MFTDRTKIAEPWGVGSAKAGAEGEMKTGDKIQMKHHPRRLRLFYALGILHFNGDSTPTTRSHSPAVTGLIDRLLLSFSESYSRDKDQ